MAKRKMIGAVTMYRFIRSTGLRTIQTGVSIYEIACDGLARVGHPKPEGVTFKKHCMALEGVILREALKAPSSASIKKAAAADKALRKAVDIADGASRPLPRGKSPAPRKPAVASVDFLRSYEWRSLRMVALKKYGAKCQCCGASPATGAVMNVDHIKPRKLYPELALELENLQVLCGDCNHGKGNWDMTDWRPSAATSMGTSPCSMQSP